MTACCKWNPLP